MTLKRSASVPLPETNRTATGEPGSPPVAEAPRVLERTSAGYGVGLRVGRRMAMPWKW